VALFILEIEQEENEMRNGLWKQFLVEMADMNKINLDQAMKVNLICGENLAVKNNVF